MRLLDFGLAADSSPYLVFELLNGETVEAAVSRARGLSTRRVAHIASQILKALMEAHSIGIVHRDIKPANVFLCSYHGEADFVKVLDFGIAKESGSRSLTRTGEIARGHRPTCARAGHWQ